MWTSLRASQFFCSSGIFHVTMQCIGKGMEYYANVRQWVERTKEYVQGQIFYDRICYLAEYKDHQYRVVYDADHFRSALLYAMDWIGRWQLLPCSYLTALPSNASFVVKHYAGGRRHEELYVHGQRKPVPLKEECPFLLVSLPHGQDVLPLLRPWMQYWSDLTVRDLIELASHVYSKQNLLQEPLSVTVMWKDTLEEQVFKAEDKLLS